MFNGQILYTGNSSVRPCKVYCTVLKTELPIVDLHTDRTGKSNETYILNSVVDLT